MVENETAAALARIRAIFERRPGSGLHADSPAVARWQRGLRVVTAHPSGRSVVSDMPPEFGGTGDEITPGWYCRAGAAACAATCIAIAAELRGVTLGVLEVSAESQSDARGIFAMREADGRAVDAAPLHIALRVVLDGNADDAVLEELARQGCACSPITRALARENVVELLVEIAR